MTRTFDDLPIPDAVRATLQEFVRDLERAAPQNVSAVILYGGLARGRYRPGKSDVNVLILLRTTGTAELDAVAPTLRAAWRRSHVEPLVLGIDELPAAAAAFPVKFLDIKRTHILLSGTDPMEGVSIDDRLARQHLRQEFHNLSMRLRRRYALEHGDMGELARMLSRLTGPLCVQLEALLALDRNPVEKDTCAVVFDKAAVAYGLDRKVLHDLELLRQGDGVADPAKLFAGALAAIEGILGALDAKGVST